MPRKIICWSESESDTFPFSLFFFLQLLLLVPFCSLSIYLIYPTIVVVLFSRFFLLPFPKNHDQWTGNPNLILLSPLLFHSQSPFFLYACVYIYLFIPYPRTTHLSPHACHHCILDVLNYLWFVQNVFDVFTCNAKWDILDCCHANIVAVINALKIVILFKLFTLLVITASAGPGIWSTSSRWRNYRRKCGKHSY